MECINVVVTTRHSRPMKWESTLPHGIPSCRLWTRPKRLAFIHHHASWNCAQFFGCIGTIYPVDHEHWGHSSWRACASSLNFDGESSSLLERDYGNGTVEGTEFEEPIPKQLGRDQLNSLLADAERAKLIRKLSDANQYNRFLKRQLLSRDDALVNFKTELAVLELELQALVGLAEEVANSNVLIGSRKINGKYIQSHLLFRLEAVHQKLKEQIMDADSLKFEEVTVVWVGMAESVQLMGSFDGWIQGVEMSPEHSGYYAKFSATLKLRPGRYEIKFLVDGEWRLSPEFPTVGEGMMMNNLLTVS